MARQITRLTTAVHEAGHAVVQLARPPFPEIRAISIVDQPNGQLGVVETDLRWQPYMVDAIPVGDVIHDWRRLAWEDIIVSLAGPIAENRWRRFSRLSIQLAANVFAARCLEHEIEAYSDEGRVVARLKWAHPGQERERFVAAWLEAEDAVAGSWRAIVAIGRTLHRRGRLSGEELTAEWARIAE